MIKPIYKVDASKLNRALARMKAVSRKAPEVIVREAAVLFTQSAARATPPDAGRATIRKKSMNRPVYALREPGRKRAARYRVPYRTLRKSGVKYFSTRAEAKSFSAIRFRGIGKAGWWAALRALGVETASQPGAPDVRRKLDTVNVAWLKKGWGKALFQTSNLSLAIKGGKLAMIARQALGKAASRLRHAAKIEAQKIAAEGRGL